MTLTISNIDPIYLTDLSDSVLIQLKKLSDGCTTYNTIKNPITGNCVLIMGGVGKKIIKELIATTKNTQARSGVKKSCAVSTYPVVKKPIAIILPTQPHNVLTKNHVKCSSKSKFAKDSNYVCNPMTGSWIKKSGPTYHKLLKSYTIQDLEDFKLSLI
jgi:hypothetical protein